MPENDGMNALFLDLVLLFVCLVLFLFSIFPFSTDSVNTLLVRL